MIEPEQAINILERSFEGVIIADGTREHLILYVNPAWEKITGWTKEEVVGKLSPRILKSGKMSSQFYEELWTTILRGDLFRGEIVNKRRDGTFYDAEINIFPVKTTGGKTVYAEVSRNITEKKLLEKERKEYVEKLETEIKERTKQLEQEIAESENARVAILNVAQDLEMEKKKIEEEKTKTDAILSSIGDGLFVTDTEGRIVLTNHVFEEFIGKKISDVIGKYYYDLWHMEYGNGQEVPLEKRPVTIALKTGKIVVTKSSDNLYYVSQGKKFPVTVTVSPIMDGKIKGVIAVFRDVTEEIKIDRAKSEFVSLASHQLRTPLTIIKWYSEMLLSEGAEKLESSNKKYLEEIYHGTERMAALIDAILNVSQIELGTFAIEFKEVNVMNITDDVIKGFLRQIKDKKISFESRYDENFPLISADSNTVRITLDNLISNAIAYTSEGGKIKLELLKSDEAVIIKVSDTGYGIPLNEQNKIFTRFYRAENVREMNPRGTGLGLYIVKSLLDQSGGKIWFESAGENKGTTFYASLPIRPLTAFANK